MYCKITIVTTRISDLQQCCHYLLNVFTKYFYFETFNITDLYNKDCSTTYYKITIVTSRISDLQQCCHYLSNALVYQNFHYKYMRAAHIFYHFTLH